MKNSEIYVNGDALTPARFWSYALITDSKNEDIKFETRIRSLNKTEKIISNN